MKDNSFIWDVVMEGILFSPVHLMLSLAKHCMVVSLGFSVHTMFDELLKM